jgi:hypothetical protein
MRREASDLGVEESSDVELMYYQDAIKKEA